MRAKILVVAFAGLALCSLTLWGCSGDQEKKQEKKTPTVQQQLGQDAAQSVQKPLAEARKAAQAETGLGMLVMCLIAVSCVAVGGRCAGAGNRRSLKMV